MSKNKITTLISHDNGDEQKAKKPKRQKDKKIKMTQIWNKVWHKKWHKYDTKYTTKYDTNMTQIWHKVWHKYDIEYDTDGTKIWNIDEKNSIKY